MTRRLGLMIVALLVALLGTTAVYSYVQRIETRTVADAEMVDVLTAATQIPSGTTADAALQGQLVAVRSMPRSSVPEGALTSLEGIGSQKAVADVFAGEVLLRAKFADQSARTGALLIPSDKIAISVELGDPQRVAGFVVPGSEVAVFVTVEKEAATDAAEGDAGFEGAQYTQLLLPRSSVIAVGPSTLRPAQKSDDEGKEAVPTAVLTLAVTQDEAERLVHSAQTGQLYLGLLNTTSKTQPEPGVTTADLLTS